MRHEKTAKAKYINAFVRINLCSFSSIAVLPQRFSRSILGHEDVLKTTTFYATKTPQSGHGSDHGGKTQMLVNILQVDLGGQISLIASVVSISAAAVKSAQTFCDLVQSIKNAPAELNVVSADTETFYIIVDDLRAALSEEQIKDCVKYDEHMVMRVGKLELPLTRCLELLDQLKVKIRSYLKTADDGQVLRFSHLERGRWFFTRSKFNELVVSLDASKATLNTAMASITMYVVSLSFTTCVRVGVLSELSNSSTRLTSHIGFVLSGSKSPA